MSKPTKEQIEVALEEAERIRESGEDPFFLSETILYMNRRLGMLEKVFDAANRYMHFGQEEHEHTELLKAIDAAQHQEKKETGDFGL